MYTLSVTIMLAALATKVASMDAVSPASLDITQTCMLNCEITASPHASGCLLLMNHVTASIQGVAKTLAEGAMSYYPGTAAVSMSQAFLWGKDCEIAQVGKSVSLLVTAVQWERREFPFWKIVARVRLALAFLVPFHDPLPNLPRLTESH